MKRLFIMIWPELSRHRNLLIFAIILGAFFSGLKSLIPLIMKKLMVAWDTGDEKMALALPIVLVVLSLVGGIFRYYHTFFMRLISELVSLRLRRLLMEKYLQISSQFINRSGSSGSGGLISRLVNDVNVIQNEIWRFSDLIKEPILVIFILTYLFYTDYKLTLFSILFIPTTILTLKYFSRSLKRYGTLSQEIVEKFTKTLKESLDGSKVVQSYNLQEEMNNRFSQEADNYLKARKKIISKESLSSPLNEFFTILIMSFILVYIGKQILAKNLSSEDFLAFLAAIMLMVTAIKKLNESYIKLIQAHVSLERTYEILSMPDIISCVENPKKFPENWQNIEFKNINFHFKENKPVLKNINLKIKRGETIAIVGSSGAGKSTLINLLERFCDPTSGEILIGGVSIKELDLKELRQKIAVVSQDVFLFSDSIEKNILFGDLSKTTKDVRLAAQAANAHDFILKTEHDYQTFVGDKGANLSGGERQRISIARALLKASPIIVLDEATSALDSESERDVQQGLKSLTEDRTVFMIAHRLSTIVHAHRIIVLDKGQVVEDGSHEKLMAQKGLYYKYQNLQ